jgi:hypothetical protein
MKQKMLVECVVPARVDWENRIRILERWIEEESVYAKRVLRLRSYAYLHMPWFSTSRAWDYLLGNESDFCLVPGYSQWITRKDFLGDDGNLIDEHSEVFEVKKQTYHQWVHVSEAQGYYAEQIYNKAFSDAGYSVEKVRIPAPPGSKERLEIDAYCVNEELRLGVQVKNVTSEVFTDPKPLTYYPDTYRNLTRQFEYCSQKGIIPILIAPFIDKHFYNFTKRYNGLHCQTFLELFRPENAAICYAVKKILKFGNVKVVTEATNRVKEWIDSIPEMWNNRYAK